VFLTTANLLIVNATNQNYKQSPHKTYEYAYLGLSVSANICQPIWNSKSTEC